MLKQIVAMTRNRVAVRAIMTKGDTSADIPVYREMEAYALGELERHFPDTDTREWVGNYELRTAPRRYPTAWGMVCLEVGR
ncbi:hypothetical protein GPROT1_03304 [Gammaproteobacteria bacterium]|nr:hypothetical protein GPROT1_03304 [Gammaproteobacteria bacterium]